ncbi:Phosphate transport system permease protein PstA [Candidatus Defluviicoccus seviourii]|uniref:Phosphate transport system permease protein PstA n=1 Tax=Candidatus Defluviicoccus seviourii TaxID=2565273 RepID=A0A564WF15_9PROT|nr:Phosphate transport system permease protein PstA [Candidatus Defluviicoccus seviourii]
MSNSANGAALPRAAGLGSIFDARQQVSEAVSAGLKRRYAREKRFRLYGMLATLFAVAVLGILLFTIIRTGLPAFTQTMIKLSVTLYPQEIDPKGDRDPQTLSSADYQRLVRDALDDYFPDVTSRNDRRELFAMISPGATYVIRSMVIADPSLIGKRIEIEVPLKDDIDQFAKGKIDSEADQANRRVSDKQIGWYQRLVDRDLIVSRFNTTLFTAGDSRSPELAGIWGAVVGSFWTMSLTLLMSFPLAVGAAVYLEEFAPKNRWTDVIEVNINNLAAVPSIVFGLLGLAVFIGFFGVPRSSPMVGALVLTLMTLPIIIIASRAALKSVPPSIREAALGVGASKMQATLHHVLPLAMPGMLTGTILGMAHALGETAPLLMIGMVAFIVDVPSGPLSSATVMPVQIYLWSDAPERAFIERASAAIMVLLGFLTVMNLLAVALRKRFEKRW